VTHTPDHSEELEDVVEQRTAGAVDVRPASTPSVVCSHKTSDAE